MCKYIYQKNRTLIRTGNRFLIIGLAAIATAAIAGPAPALAEEKIIEETIVHARKRTENVTEVPVAVTLLGSDAIKKQLITRIEDLGQVAPNVIVKQSASTSGAVEALIRGQIVAISNPANDPPVGLYFDDVYVAQSKGAAISVFDLEAIEIARGVQGTLSGRNNTGGAIRFYSKKPDLENFSSSLSGSFGSNGLWRGSAVINLLVSNTFAVRIGYLSNNQDEQGKSVITGSPFQGIDQQLWRISALWAPNDRFTNHLIYEGVEIDQPQMNTRAVRGTKVAADLLAGTNVSGRNPFLKLIPESVLFPSNIHDNSWDLPVGGDKIDVDFVRNTTSFDISDNLQAKLTLGYREMEALSAIDVDFSPGYLAHATDFGALSEQVTVEPQISGKAFGERLDWVAGAYYFKDEAFQPSTTAIPRFPINIYDSIENTSRASYLHGEFAATERLKVAAGVRITKDKRDYSPYRSIFVRPNDSCILRDDAGPIGPGMPCPPVSLKADFDYWSYEFTAAYVVNDQVNVYARIGRGQKSGGYTSPLIFITTPPFKPEEVDDFEIGMKAQGLAGGSLDINIAAFYSDLTNMQRYTSGAVPGVPGISSQTFNAGKATVAGLEFDFAWRATDALTFSGYIGYTDAEYDEFDVTNAAGDVVDFSNNAFRQTPEFMSRLAASYDVPLASGDLSINGGWYYQSSMELYVSEFPQMHQEAYGLFNARIAWTSKDEKWEVSLWGTNLADEEYAVAASASPTDAFDPSKGLNSGGLVIGDERSIGSTVTVRWGE